MNARVRKPTMRICEACGRNERWDENVDAWQLVNENGEKQVGDPHCIHEWDITGTFNPVVASNDGR